MEIRKILITPQLAQEMLKKNTNNRNVSNAKVKQYSREMKNGSWMEDTGELIKISENSVIMDGQHRLLAVVDSNKSICFHLATGIKEDRFNVLDTGKSRSAADIFKINGVKNATTISSILNLYNNVYINKSKGNKPTDYQVLRPQELLNMYHERPAYWQSVFAFADKMYNKFQKIWNKTEIALFKAMLDHIDGGLSEDFIAQICEGVNVDMNCIVLLRNKLIMDKTNTKTKTPASQRRALVIKTWNAFYTGKDLKLLRFTSESEKYPEIEGFKN